MFRNIGSTFRNISYKIGSGGKFGYKTIRDIEKKAKKFDVGLGGIPGDIWRATPASMFYNQSVVPAKQALKITGEIFSELGKEEKPNKMKVAESLIDSANLISGGTNDFLDRAIKSDTFNNLFKSPYIQNYLMS